MKTVRFTNVVGKAGKPEIYLLLDRDDPEFKRALKADRVMSLVGAEGSKTAHGEIGYDEKQRAQLLVFPKSLKAFEGMRVVGIDYESFTDHSVEKPIRKSETKKSAPKQKKAAKTGPAPESGKVIHFPKPEPEEKEPLDAEEMQAYARRALKALEKNNSVAAYNLLKRMLGEE